MLTLYTVYCHSCRCAASALAIRCQQMTNCLSVLFHLEWSWTGCDPESSSIHHIKKKKLSLVFMYHPQQSTEEQPEAAFYNDGISLEHLLHWFIVWFPFCSDHNSCHWGHITWFVSNRKKVFENCWQRQKEVCKGCEFPGSLPVNRSVRNERRKLT